MRNPEDDAVNRFLDEVVEDSMIQEDIQSLDDYLTHFKAHYWPVFQKHGFTLDTALLVHETRMAGASVCTCGEEEE